MPPRINRAALTLEVGESLRELARRLASINEYTGDARGRELRSMQMQLRPLVDQLKRVIDNCRAAGGAYPNYPAVRKAIQDGGDQVYALQAELLQLIIRFDGSVQMEAANFSDFVAQFAQLGQQLKLIQFAPPLAQETPTV